MSDQLLSSRDARVGAGMRVTLHFGIYLTSGEEVDTTRRRMPATFEFGDGNLLPGFEAALVGMKAGDDAQIEIECEQAFGAHRPENVQTLPRHRFQGMALEPGVMVSFGASDGELPGVVRSVEGLDVIVDFNHPLAGKALIFDVSILAVEGV